MVKSNAIVQKSRYFLSVSEQKSIAYICSMIKPITPEAKAMQSPYCPDSPWQLEYDFNIRDYARICGLACDNGRIYEETKAILKGLRDKSMWLTLEDGTETTVAWVSRVWTNKKKRQSENKA